MQVRNRARVFYWGLSIDGDLALLISCTIPAFFLKKGAWLQLNARNLTDKKYLAACYGTGYCYRGAERTLTATIGYDF